MSRRRPLHCALLVLLLAAAGSAHAQGSGPGRGPDRGIDAQTFRPSIDGFGLLTVERAETSRQWDFGFKLTIDYAHLPLQLALHEPGKDPTGQRVPVIDWQTTLHFGAHLGLTDWLEVGLVVPVSAQSYGALYGSPYDDRTNGPTGFYAGGARTNVGPPSAGVLDPRLALKARTRRLGPVGVALVVAATLPIGDESAFLGESGFTFRPSGVFDLTVGRFTLALNLGAILRTSTTTVVDPLPAAGQPPAVLIGVGHELAASLGAQLRVTSWMAIAAEVYSLIPLVVIPGPGPGPGSDGTDVADKVLGVLGALRFSPGREVTLSIGGGAGVPINPDGGPRRDAFRLLCGLSWTPSDAGRGGRGGGGDRDGDGIPDGADLCAEAAEDKDGFEDGDGCPDLDNDGDGVPDGADRCREEPEDRDGFQDGDGCPDADNDGDGVPDVAPVTGAAGVTLDGCPDEPEDQDGYQDEDGCPDPDNDGDGVPDARDRCPDEAESENGIDDQDGCPDSGGEAEAALPVGALTTPVIETVFCERAEAQSEPRLRAGSAAILERAARLATARPGRRARVIASVERSHADGALAAACGNLVRDELVQRGADAGRIEVVLPGRTPRSKRAKADPRRVDIEILEVGR